jgi:virginiamycin B lyase
VLGSPSNLWFTEFAANKIGMINPTTHVITEYPVPTATSQPFGITAGPDGNLWLTEFNQNKIGALNPATKVITETTLPSAVSGPAGIMSGPDGNLWFTEFIGRRQRRHSGR